MILTGDEIQKQVQKNRIHIKPFEEQYINPNSYNYRLGFNLFEVLDRPLDPKSKPATKVIEFSNNGYILEPGRLYLANTYEEIGSNYYVTSLIGRSSLGRLGLFLQITADLGHLGAKHCWTLELKVVQPLLVYPKMIIGQVTFWMVKGDCKNLYNGKYAIHSEPHVSEIRHELEGML